MPKRSMETRDNKQRAQFKVLWINKADVSVSSEVTPIKAIFVVVSDKALLLIIEQNCLIDIWKSIWKVSHSQRLKMLAKLTLSVALSEALPTAVSHRLLIRINKFPNNFMDIWVIKFTLSLSLFLCRHALTEKNRLSLSMKRRCCSFACSARYGKDKIRWGRKASRELAILSEYCEMINRRVDC